MRRFILAALATAALAAPAFAGCEDGSSMAEEAATKALGRTTDFCELLSVSDPRPTSDGESYLVKFRCNDSQVTYRVALREIEDAMCVVKRVTRTHRRR